MPQHIVEVDQCRKIEQSGPTVLAFSNGISHAILIPARVKIAGLGVLRSRGKSAEIAPLLLFAACLYLLLRDHLGELQKVIVDREYEGHEADIRSFMLEYIKREGQSFEPRNITFALVGKKSPADKKARDVRRGKDKVYRRIGLEELLAVVQ